MEFFLNLPDINSLIEEINKELSKRKDDSSCITKVLLDLKIHLENNKTLNSEYLCNLSYKYIYQPRSYISNLNTNFIPERLFSEDGLNNLSAYKVKPDNPPKSNDTVIIYHQDCFDHAREIFYSDLDRVKQRNIQVENPDRLSVLIEPPFGTLLGDFFSKNCDYKADSKPACLADVTRVHSYNYIKKIKSICDDLKSKNINSVVKIDSDTFVNSVSIDVAFQAAGCAINAVDLIMKGEYKSAFVAIRPPGHHVGYFGKVEEHNMEDEKSNNGFCIFNNIAIAAGYLKYCYKVEKIAIIDFDVHHGNGTEEIIRNLSCNEMNMVKFGYKSLFGELEAKFKVAQPWLDFDDDKDVLFISIHGFDLENPDMFYPCTGSLNSIES